MDDEPAASAPSDDLSALAWVYGELRRSLELAHKALRRYLKEAEALGGSDVDSVDPVVLRTARAQIHQGVGALELVGLPAAAQLLRGSEAAVQRLAAKPALVDAAAVDAIERASFGLLDFLGRTLAGKAVSPLALFPQYRAVLTLAGAERVHPADLWLQDWVWHELPRDASATPRVADNDAREAMEALALAAMRHPAESTFTQLSDLCADLGAGGRGRLATLWQLAAGFFDAQASQLLAADVYSKRVASKLLAQLRATIKGDEELSDRLAQDLLFFCARAQSPAAGSAPRLAAVRRAWQLGAGERADGAAAAGSDAGSAAADYETPRLGRFDPAWIAQARKRVAGAKDAWSAVAGGELHRLSGLAEQFALVGDSLQRLFPSGDVLAGALQTAVAQTVSAGVAPAPQLAMEVATSILYLDASLEDGELDHSELAGRVQRLARRIDDVRIGAEGQPLEAWMEELYRRVSDRQTMGSVVQELRAALSDVEKQIDQYFRDPAQRQVLIPVPNQLSAMRGVLSVLGMDQASQAVLHMRDDVDALAQTEVDPQRAVQTGTFDRLADNLGALSFLIDMLSVQPALAKSLFRFDPETGNLSAVMGQSERVSAFAAFDDAPAVVPTGEAPTLQTLDLDLPVAEPRTSAPVPLAAAVATPTSTSASASAAATSGLEDDAEMREVFIEEAREVIGNARASLDKLSDQPEDLGEMTAVRRAFHTLKGSGRMVGLRDYGEAAWACEQLFNARLAQSARMDHPLRAFTGEALNYLGAWTEAIADGRDDGHRAPPVARAADALRLDGQRISIDAPQVTIALPKRAPTAPVAPAAADAAAPSAPSAPALDLTAEPDAEPAIDASDDVLLPGWAAEAAAAPMFQAAEEPLLEPLPESLLEPTGSALSEAAEPNTLQPPAPGLQALSERIPDLPSASDLDLSPAAIAVGDVAEEVSFDLDFADFDADAPASGPPAPPHAPPPALPELVLDGDSAPPEPATQAVEAVEAVELDLADFDFAEPASEPAATAHETAPVAHDEAPQQALASGLEVQPGTPGVLQAPDPAPLEPTAHEASQPAPADVLDVENDDEQVKLIGPLRISIPLFNIYLNEADELSRRLNTELAEWSLEYERHPVSDAAVALAHSLAGNSATVGYAELSALARSLEHALMRSHALGRGRAGEPELFSEAGDEIRRLLHQFAAGFLRPVEPGVMERLADHERWPMLAAVAAEGDEGDDIDTVDALDDELFPIFEEEADELLPQLQNRLRDWADEPAEPGAAAACMRTLHTFKGGARLAGAMRLGEMAHRLETAIEQLAAGSAVQAGDIEPLLARADAMSVAYDALRGKPLAPPPQPPLVQVVPAAVSAAQPLPAAPLTVDGHSGHTEPGAAPGTKPAAAPVIDWSRFTSGSTPQVVANEQPAPAGTAVVRVRGALLDRLVNQAGEVSITRARIDADVHQLQGSLNELTDSLDRMRRQLRDIELQAETQMSSRLEAAKAASAAFDPLEMDRFTRFQELTRFMAESVNDVATLQRSLQRTLQSTEDELAAQARLTRELQDDLLRTRMVEFDSMADRLYRTVRQAAKETGKQVRLDIVGGAIEMDRGVLERMAGPFEHLLRNSVAHGIENPEQRAAAGKERGGTITVTITQEGNEVGVEVRDDGAGLDRARIRTRGIERGLIGADAQPGDDELSQLIFAPGFSTVEHVTELAGRGVGMDVVRSEVDAMGGRVQISSSAGAGTAFRLLLPLTTAVTQVVMLRCGELNVAVPSTLIEIVRRMPTAEIDAAYASGSYTFGDDVLPFYWLAALLQAGTRGPATGRTQPLVVIRSAAQRVALHVDEVVGNQEVVVKNVGPQLARLPGLAGVTLLPSGQVALIYNPVALAMLYGAAARALMQRAPELVQPVAAPTPSALAPLVLVVDDSLTVRRVTQRLLVREGYRVTTAKDGLDALERLAEERPAVLLSDIEMPRMDGFDLVRNVRAEARLADLPVIMITSRIAQKHRDYAASLGVDHYLGKPYSEEELLALVGRYAGADIPT